MLICVYMFCLSTNQVMKSCMVWVGKEGELWWDADDDCVGGLNFGDVGGVGDVANDDSVIGVGGVDDVDFGDVGGVGGAGDNGVGGVGAGPALSSTQHYQLLPH